MISRHFSRILLVICCLLGVFAAGAQARLVVGISDNGWAMFHERSFTRLGITTARSMVPWNVAVMRDGRPLAAERAWLDSARSAHVTPLVTFSADAGAAGNVIPSVGAYTRAVRAFIHDFPWVKLYSAWNEPDFIFRKLASEPQLAAAYFNALAGVCHGCSLVAGDVYRPAWQGLAAWVRTYSHYLRARPVAWALHPYDDIRSHTTSAIQAVLSVTSGPLWLTEISGVVRRGHWKFSGHQSPAAANRDERFLFSLPKRFPRIQRIYHYQWQAAPRATWDSGLLGPGGKPRPAYWTVASAVRGKLP